jgi:hypothetical protein
MGYRSRIMTMDTKNNIFDEHLSAYLKASKEEKGAILKHVCFVAGYHRKAAIRKFKSLQMKDAGKQEGRGRQEYYTPDVTVALKTVWEAGAEVCGELLYPMIAEYVRILKRDKLWEHGSLATEKLLAMSEGTVKRRVGKFKKARVKKKGLTDTKPSHIKHLVPIFIGPWKGKEPGFGQVDTVRHSNTAFGDAVYSLNYTDASTLMPMLRAQWNKGQQATRTSMREVKTRMPFPWLGAHPDTGSEFINSMVMKWCQEEKIELSRSRPNHKNDNMYVEERNGHAIRKFIGYQTLNCPEAVDALNAVYDILNPYLLHFVAVRRMTGKEKLSSKYKRTYERRAKTPYQRILEHKAVSEEVKTRLRAEHEQLNPLLLKQEIDRRIRKLYDTQKRYGNPPPTNLSR